MAPPQDELQFIHYFCGNTEIAEDLAAHVPQRETLYKAVAGLLRAYASIAEDLPEAGYSPTEAKLVEAEVERAVKLRAVIRQASGETLDLKTYEADMRFLIDSYIKADDARKISNFGELGLLDLIVKLGIADAIAGLPKSVQASQGAVAETIANNVRSKIIKSSLTDPAFYAKMSALLAEVLDDLKAKRISYEEFLQKISELAQQVHAGKADDTPVALDTEGKRALFNNLGQNEALALQIDKVVKQVRPNSWRGNLAKERTIKAALLPLLGGDMAEIERIFAIISAQGEY